MRVVVVFGVWMVVLSLWFWNVFWVCSMALWVWIAISETYTEQGVWFSFWIPWLNSQIKMNSQFRTETNLLFTYYFLFLDANHFQGLAIPFQYLFQELLNPTIFARLFLIPRPP